MAISGKCELNVKKLPCVVSSSIRKCLQIALLIAVVKIEIYFGFKMFEIR